MNIHLFKVVVEFKVLLLQKLSYSEMSNMNFDEYKVFVFYFFREVDSLRRNGLLKEHIYSFVNEYYGEVISNVDEDDIMFQRRFEVFIEELMEFCSFPFFWETEIEIYLKKWERVFESNWFKEL